MEFKNFKTMKFRGQTFDNGERSYWVDTSTGEAYSLKRLEPNDSGGSNYPKIQIQNTTIPMHQMVAENCHSKEDYIPKGISAQDWKRTPDQVKVIILKDGVDVHHKDGNKWNYNPSNLEYLGSSENRRIGKPNAKN